MLQRHILTYLQQIIDEAVKSGKSLEDCRRLYPMNYGANYMKAFETKIKKAYEKK